MMTKNFDDGNKEKFSSKKIFTISFLISLRRNFFFIFQKPTMSSTRRRFEGAYVVRLPDVDRYEREQVSYAQYLTQKINDLSSVNVQKKRMAASPPMRRIEKRKTRNDACNDEKTCNDDEEPKKKKKKEKKKYKKKVNRLEELRNIVWRYTIVGKMSYYYLDKKDVWVDWNYFGILDNDDFQKYLVKHGVTGLRNGLSWKERNIAKNPNQSSAPEFDENRILIQ